MFQFIKFTFFKIYCNLLISSESAGDPIERIESFGHVLMYFAPFAFIVGVLGLWYEGNKVFTLSAAGFVFGNAIIGLVAHFMRGDFNWETFLTKTMKMVVIIAGVYFVLELIISPIGDNQITDGFMKMKIVMKVRDTIKITEDEPTTAISKATLFRS
jgi:hypothetical protein